MFRVLRTISCVEVSCPRRVFTPGGLYDSGCVFSLVSYTVDPHNPKPEPVSMTQFMFITCNLFAM